MKTIVTAGIVLGLLVVIVSFVLVGAGIHNSTSLAFLFPVLATLTQIAVLVWGLMQTAKTGRRYGRQVVAGLLISLVASVIIFFGSLSLTSVAFPNYFAEVEAMQVDAWTASGMTEEQITTMLEMTAPFRSAMVNAITGAIATIVTGLIISLITAAFVRTKS